MYELPETITLARHINQTLAGKTMAGATAAHTPHKFAWYAGNPAGYSALLRGRRLEKAEAFGMYCRVTAQDTELLFGDGVRLRYLEKDEKRPPKHQLLIDFEDGSALVASVQMYGGMWVSGAGSHQNPYFTAAVERPSPLDARFDEAYFEGLVAEASPSTSAKALLATGQHIPGLGNGVLQDILFAAKVHPKQKVAALGSGRLQGLYHAVKVVLAEMTEKGGRSTEKDLYGRPGGYPTLLHAGTAGTPCPVCGTPIEKQTYMGGSVYFCPVCQPLG